MSDVLVCKFGGTSVGSVEKIKAVADRLINYKKNGKLVVVVVSAMGKSTDELLNLAYQVNEKPSARELDMLVSTGEQVSISLLSMAISGKGYDVIALTGSQCGIHTIGEHKNARISEINSHRLEYELIRGKIVIVAGFQGINDAGDITTLGRGGSDTTAVALAAHLGAKKCEIFTDVDGVFSSDPRYVKNAKKLDYLSYDDMLEMAKQGAGVIHPRSIEIARAYNVEVEIRNSHNENSGTIIGGNDMIIEKPYIRGVVLQENLARITIADIPHIPGVAFKLFRHLSENTISVDMIVQNEGRELNDISFTTTTDDVQSAKNICESFIKEIGAGEVLVDPNVVKISIIGTGILGYSDIAGKFFKTLSDMMINIEMISTSESKISVIINKEHGKEATNKLHDVLFG